MRDGLVKARTAQMHQIPAAFYEFGIELPDTQHWCVKSPLAAFARLEGKFPRTVVDALQMQLELIRDLTWRVEEIERKLAAYKQSNERCKRLLKVPGVGLLKATAIVAGVGDAKEFSLRTRIRCLAGIGATAVGNRRASASTWDQ